MKKNRILSALLCLSLAAGLVIPGLPAYAEGEGESGSNSGMKLNKTAVANSDGTYTITLEAYATGEKVISQVKQDVPTDIILVLDQSGSMDTKDFPSVGEATYTPYTGDKTKNSNLYSERHNNNGSEGNLYYKLDDGSYATVSVVRTWGVSSDPHKQCPSDWQNDKYPTYSDWDPDDYWKYSDNLYVKNEAGEYQKVKVARKQTGEWYDRYYVYTYTFPNGKEVTSNRDNGKPGSNNFDGNGPVYYLSSTTAGEYTYTYTCTDAEGKTINIGTSTGEDTRFTGATLYYRTVTNGGDIKRLQALINAVTAFTNSVAEKAKGADGKLGTEDDIDHRIAVVGFAARENTNPGNYVNTELFIGATQYKYGTDAQEQYGNAFQNMKTSQGQVNVAASIGALDAYGGTHIDLGMEMAKGVLDKSPVSSGEKRNRVVIVFTDGSPGSGNWSSNDMTYAQNAIDYANTLRDDSVNVYTVGIFEGADATNAGNQTGNSTQKANWFMQNLSDNMGTPRTPSYYLSAADSNTLNNIFQQIADNIETGGSSTTLDANAVIRDIIAPQFELPANATTESIKLYTAESNGSVNSWKTRETFAGSVSPGANDNSVSVSGFSFKDNWCGNQTINGQETFHDGKKLIIEFTVQPKAGFLGGNDVYTNTSAGVYESANAQNPVLTFDRPQVNVRIKDVTVTAADKNVYLKGEVTADQLKDGSEISVGNVKLDLTKDNYGLEAWQTEYVDITITVMDKDGNPISDKLENLTEDTTYTVQVTVEPKTVGTSTPEKGDAATAKTGANNPAANINVFKPELTYKDSEVFYGETAPTDFNSNLKKTVWKHNDKEATADMGPAPELIVTYSTEDGKIYNGKINSKKDIPVAATVKIGTTDVTDKTTFAHNACNPACGWNETTLDGNPAFLLHVKTASLTITKTGIDAIDHNGSEKQSNIFTVTGKDPAGKDITITLAITGNGSATVKDLPLGDFKVTENDDWCWRYTTQGTKTVEVTKTGASVTFTNTRKNPSYWLSGDNVQENQFTINGSQG